MHGNMKTGMLIFLLTLAVPSSQFQTKCVLKYAECAVPVINKWNDLTNCSVAVTFFKCITTVSEECDTHVTPIFRNILNFSEAICPDAAKREDMKKAGECVIKNTDSFKSCTRNPPEDPCNATRSIVQCTSSTMHDKCGAFAGNMTDRLMVPIQLLANELCWFIGKTDYDDTAQCLTNITESFRSPPCKLSGDFNKIGDICSSIDGYAQCLVGEIGKICGAEAENLAQVYMAYATIALGLCRNITIINSVPIPECYKEILKCEVDIFNVGEPKCTDLSNHVGCLADAARKCEEINPLYLIVLEKYKNKFPEYCDKDSSFNKNMEKQGLCIDENTEKVFNPCFENLKKDTGLVWSYDAGTLRVYLNFLHCISNGFREKCSKEAEDAINDLLLPLGDAFDESCRMMTGKRCNGACGLKVATWIFIASLVYLLTRRHE